MKVKSETKEFINYLVDNNVCSETIFESEKELSHIQRVIQKTDEEALKIRKKTDKSLYECYILWKAIGSNVG